MLTLLSLDRKSKPADSYGDSKGPLMRNNSSFPFRKKFSKTKTIIEHHPFFTT